MGFEEAIKAFLVVAVLMLVLKAGYDLGKNEVFSDIKYYGCEKVVQVRTMKEYGK